MAGQEMLRPSTEVGLGLC